MSRPPSRTRPRKPRVSGRRVETTLTSASGRRPKAREQKIHAERTAPTSASSVVAETESSRASQMETPSPAERRVTIRYGPSAKAGVAAATSSVIQVIRLRPDAATSAVIRPGAMARQLSGTSKPSV